MATETKLRFGTLGAGFWANYQLAAWSEAGGAECVAIYNRTRAKAESLAGKFGIPSVYDNAERLLETERLDFVDIITDVETHPKFVLMAIERGIPAICQKPMAPTFSVAQEMVEASRTQKVPFFIHENWRWQRPIQELKQVLTSGMIGQPFRARIRMVSGFKVFENQPFLAELERFILTDMGSHVLDVARFLFGEAESVYCQSAKVHESIKGEDVATVIMPMGPSRTTVTVEMGYPGNYAEHDRFPETYIVVEGSKGTLELGPDYWIRVTTAEGTHAKRTPPPRYAWADPRYDLVHASIVPCNVDLLAGIRGERPAQTTGEDNLKTTRLVFAAYDSAERNAVVRL
ncbi:MAG TPA: Gfo/Idh/MocA family oxidoreductase [Methylomirabilota bacterium]|nr:Gfo/Idh/MocA family oxidoreductase [Methylomirabilota bacterium]